MRNKENESRPVKGRRPDRKRRPTGDTHSSHKKQDEFFLVGRNPVYEALQMNQVQTLFVATGKRDERLASLVDIAKRQGLSVVEKPNETLDDMADGVRHQGVVASMKPYEYKDMESVLGETAGQEDLVILLDGVEDVRNIGAIVRTAECAGVKAVLLPKHKSAPITAAAMKTAAGAFSYLPVCQTGNIRQTLETLKGKGYWVVGADMEGEHVYTEANMKGPLAIVMGAEGKGIGTLTKKLCDFLVRIPMKGQVSSLNVSVATALLVYEALRQRGHKQS